VAAVASEPWKVKPNEPVVVSRKRAMLNLNCWFAAGLFACAVVLVSALNGEVAGWFALPICSLSIVRCWRGGI
jgi:hypothetical protein